MKKFVASFAVVASICVGQIFTTVNEPTEQDLLAIELANDVAGAPYISEDLGGVHVVTTFQHLAGRPALATLAKRYKIGLRLTRLQTPGRFDLIELISLRPHVWQVNRVTSKTSEHSYTPVRFDTRSTVFYDTTDWMDRIYTEVLSVEQMKALSLEVKQDLETVNHPTYLVVECWRGEQLRIDLSGVAELAELERLSAKQIITAKSAGTAIESFDKAFPVID
jgi:hypothetical protein